MRERSYTLSPPRGYGRRGRSPPRGGRYSSRDAPTSLLVRNLRHDCSDPRGFGFVQYVDPADAAEAKYQMDGQILHGRELTVVFAEENRKKPTEMRARERGGRGRFYDRRRSPPCYSRSRSPRYSRPPPRYGRSHSRSRDYYSPPKRKYSRSISPRDRRYSRERSYLRSPVREQSPPYEGPRNRSGTSVRERSPYGSRSRSQSPGRARSPVRARSPSRSRSRSPYPAEYPRETGRDTSPSPSQ